MEEKKLTKHPIQLAHFKVTKLFIEPNLDIDQDLEADTGKFTLTTGYGEYNQEDHAIMVTVEAKMSSEDEGNPFDLDIGLLGVFEVNEDEFPLIHIEDWAKRNAPIILYPYLREQVFSLTTRCGYRGSLLPLLEVPTFKLQK